MFRHSDGRNCIEGSVAHVAKILQSEFDQVAYALTLSVVDGVAALLFGQRDADDRRTVLARRVYRHGPHPQPTSRSRAPGASSSFRATRSTLRRCASSSVSSGERNTAHEYVIEGPSTIS